MPHTRVQAASPSAAPPQSTHGPSANCPPTVCPAVCGQLLLTCPKATPTSLKSQVVAASFALPTSPAAPFLPFLCFSPRRAQLSSSQLYPTQLSSTRPSPTQSSPGPSCSSAIPPLVTSELPLLLPSFALTSARAPFPTLFLLACLS